MSNKELFFKSAMYLTIREKIDKKMFKQMVSSIDKVHQ